MREMRFSDHTEYSFWGNVEFTSNEEAKLERDRFAAMLKAEGCRVRRSVLHNQCRKYAGLGQPDGTVGHVYQLSAYPPAGFSCITAKSNLEQLVKV